MQLSTHVFFLLFCCTAQPASSLSAAASSSWQWPWSKPRDPPKSWAPVEANATDLVERTGSSPAHAAEEAPALQAWLAAEQLQDKKQKLEAELEAAQQELKAIPGAQQSQGWAASAARALKLAEEKAAETARAAEAEQSRVQGLQAELAAKQRELEEAAMPQQAREQAHEQVAEQAHEQAGTEAAEQTTTDPLQDLEARLAAKQRELRVLEARQKIEASVEAQQSKLDEAIRSQQARAQAAKQAEADRAAQALRLAEAQAAEKAHAERLQALLQEVLEKQRQLKEVTEQAQVLEQQRQLEEVTEQARQLAGQSVDTLMEPTQPGCYMRSPSACPKTPMKNTLWRMDSFAVKQGVGKEGCHQRKSVWDKYCGSEDTQMAFVAEEALSK